MSKILTSDIGATNSRFGFFEAEDGGKPRLVKSEWFKTADFSSFVDLVGHLRETGFPLDPEESDIAVFSIAGPVESGARSSPPYISWDVDLSYLAERFEIRRSLLINDFVAQAYACRSPIGEAAEEILGGAIVRDAAAAVIGAGTALGKAALVPIPQTGIYLAVPSEGGHASFPFGSKAEGEFRDFLMRELGEEYITANMVVSGRGLSYIHEFLTGEKLSPEEISAKAGRNSETVIWASRFYGRVCRNFALEVLAMGGVYIAGGVAAKMPELVTHGAFGKEFRSSKTLGAILREIPVYLITDENSGLWGAALLGAQELLQSK